MKEIDRDKILLKIYEEQQQMKKDNDENQKSIEQKIYKVQQEIQKELTEVKEDVRNISRTVAKIEVEHGEKLTLLFDAFTMNSEKLDTHEKRINNCERKVETHDDKIYYIEKDVKQIKEAY